MTDAERETRNGIVDILCFLAAGHPTEEEMKQIRDVIARAAQIVERRRMHA